MDMDLFYKQVRKERQERKTAHKPSKESKKKALIHHFSLGNNTMFQLGMNFWFNK
jgi:hypothetical protein